MKKTNSKHSPLCGREEQLSHCGVKGPQRRPAEGPPGPAAPQPAGAGRAGSVSRADPDGKVGGRAGAASACGQTAPTDRDPPRHPRVQSGGGGRRALGDDSPWHVCLARDSAALGGCPTPSFPLLPPPSGRALPLSGNSPLLSPPVPQSGSSSSWRKASSPFGESTLRWPLGQGICTL